MVARSIYTYYMEEISKEVKKKCRNKEKNTGIKITIFDF